MWVLDEPLDGQIGAAPVAARQTLPADPQLALLTDRNGIKSVVKDVYLGFVYGLADGDEIVAGQDPRKGGIHRGLGGAITVPQLTPCRQQAIRQGRGQRLAAADYAQFAIPLPACLQQQAPGGGRCL